MADFLWAWLCSSSVALVNGVEKVCVSCVIYGCALAGWHLCPSSCTSMVDTGQADCWLVALHLLRLTAVSLPLTLTLKWITWDVPTDI